MQTKIIRNVTTEDLREAAECIRTGGLVAFPTETVYGLGASALDSEAAKKIYAAKGRPSDNPLIIHLFDPHEAEKYCYTTKLYYQLAMAFMPGPLTVILKKKPCIPDTVTGGLDTVAVRIPSHPVARKFIAACGVPVAAPSANISGKPSPTTVDHVIEDMSGKVNMILDGGPCEIGVESTIVSLFEEDGKTVLKLLRPGGITPEMLSPFCEELILDPCLTKPMAAGQRPLAPGMKYKHYAPNADVIMLDGNEDEVYRFMSSVFDRSYVGLMIPQKWQSDFTSERVVSLGSGYGEEARNLFACLRYFDHQPQIKTVYAPLPGKEGLGLAVFNRLAKAAGFTVKKL